MQEIKFRQKLFEQFFVPPYAIFLVLVGIYLRKISDPVLKQRVCTLLGVSIYIFCIKSVNDIIFTVCIQILNCIIIRTVGPKFVIFKIFLIPF